MLCSTGIPTLQSILSFTAGEEVSLALLSCKKIYLSLLCQFRVDSNGHARYISLKWYQYSVRNGKSTSATEEKERDAGVGHRIVTVVREQLAMESLKKAGALKTNRDTMAH